MATDAKKGRAGGPQEEQDLRAARKDVEQHQYEVDAKKDAIARMTAELAPAEKLLEQAKERLAGMEKK